jgi:hypothetical protein
MSGLARLRGGDRGGVRRPAARRVPAPEIVVGAWRAARAEQDDIPENEAREALLQLDPLWDELFPAARRAEAGGDA